MEQWVTLALVFAIFYFIVIRPEQDKQKKRKEMIANLAKNDKVITQGGIHGVVVLVKETTITLRVDDGTRIEFDKDAVAVKKDSSQSKGDKGTS